MTEPVTEEIQKVLADLADKRFSESLCSIFDYSEFVRRIFSRYPESINHLITCGDLSEIYSDNLLVDKIRHRTVNIETQEKLESVLREIRHVEMVRIVWRELAGVSDIEESMRDLSSLADTLVEVTTNKHLQWLNQRFGQPVSDVNGETSGFVIFAMGKLGGCELNFSSDIDLIFAYSDTGMTDGHQAISNNEFFIKLGQAIFNSLNNTTVDGFVYRVDMRLRPNGQSGPLVMSFSAMENYYQIHGREWERYAWIKARVIAGDRERGEAFLAQLRPFVFRKYLDYQVYDSLEEMKNLINKEIRQQGMQKNIKLGRGGIREIEFIAQSHQLVRGGREPELRTRSLKQALLTLGKLNQIEQQVVSELYRAYLFLRTIEHRLQIKNDQQTHQLPDSVDECSELASSFELDLDELEQRLTDTRDFVHGEFKKLHRDKRSDKSEDDWQLLWRQAVAGIQEMQIASNEELITSLKAYADSKAYRALESRGRRLADQLIPEILRLVTQTDQPAQSLNRVLDIISAIGGRTAYLSLLVQFPIACKQLIQLCASSSWVSQWIAQHPIVLDTLINPRTDQYIFNDQALELQVASKIEQETDDELKHDILRQIHHSSILQIAISDLQHQYQVTEIRKFVSNTAEIIINQVVHLCRSELQAKFGLPQGNVDDDYFAVIAYGKLGSRELSYNADLDLVFIYDDVVLREQTAGGNKSVRIDYYFSRLVQRIITMLNMQTAAGKLYDVDTRLRPSGQSGLLVSSLTQYKKYQTEQAWTWEHQALIKARMISKAPSLNQKFEKIRKNILTISRSQDNLSKEIISMRDRMRVAKQVKSDFEAKTDYGGMIDIEFISQYLVLLHAVECEDLCRQRSVVGILNVVEQQNLINKSQVNLLQQTYTKLLEFENRYKLHQPIIDSDNKELSQLMEQVYECWNQMFA